MVQPAPAKPWSKAFVVSDLDRTLAALADPTRRGVIDLLRSEPRRAGALAWWRRNIEEKTRGFASTDSGGNVSSSWLDG